MFAKRFLWGYLLCMMGLMSSSLSYAQSAPSDFTGPTWYDYREAITEGEGSMTDPILISTPGQLAQLAYDVNSGTNSYKNKVVALAADIDLNKEVGGQRVQWVPIGSDADHCFKGLFVGLNMNGSLPGLIFELKAATKGAESLDKLAAGALQQIDEKRYEMELRASGIQEVFKIGMAFRGKEIAVKEE